jgi:hypothetical protein
MKYLYILLILVIGFTIYNFDFFALKPETKAKNAVVDHIKNMAIDPTSYVDIAWSPLIKDDIGGYEINHEFLLANRMGGKGREKYKFKLNKYFIITEETKSLY